MLIVFCLAMPLWFYSIFGPHAKLPPLNVFLYIPNPLLDISGFLKGVFANLVGYRYKQFYLLLAGLLFPFLIPDKKRFQQIAFLFIMVFIPIGLILIIDIVTEYWFIQRHFIWVMPFFALFLGWSWESFILYITEKFGFKKISR